MSTALVVIPRMLPLGDRKPPSFRRQGEPAAPRRDGPSLLPGPAHKKRVKIERMTVAEAGTRRFGG
ncbi:hypothetical protein GCM10017750_00730 [Streptomyces racemochromogenes]